MEMEKHFIKMFAESLIFTFSTNIILIFFIEIKC